MPRSALPRTLPLSLCAALWSIPALAWSQVPAPTAVPEARPYAAPAGSTLIALGQGDKSITLVDGATLERRARLQVEHTPHEVVASADGRTAYVMLYGDQQPGNQIAVVDLAAGSVLRTVSTAPLWRPHGVVRVGDDLLFTSESSRAIARFDTSTDRVEWVLGHGGSLGHMLAVDEAKGLAYVPNMASAELAVLSLAPFAGGPGGIARIPVPPAAEGLALSPDGQEVWLGHKQGGLVSVVDTESRTVVASIDAGSFPFRLAFSADGSRVYWTQPDRGELVYADATTREIRGRIQVGNGPTGFVLAAGGWAYVSLIGAGEVAVVDLEQGAVAQRVTVGAAPDGVCFAVPTAG
jgi:YVTN family beta-propeller protein